MSSILNKYTPQTRSSLLKRTLKARRARFSRNSTIEDARNATFAGIKTTSNVTGIEEDLRFSHRFLSLFGITFNTKKGRGGPKGPLQLIKLITKYSLITVYAILSLSVLISLATGATSQAERQFYVIHNTQFEALQKIVLLSAFALTTFVLSTFGCETYRKILQKCIREWKIYSQRHEIRFGEKLRRRKRLLVIGTALVTLATFLAWVYEIFVMTNVRKMESYLIFLFTCRSFMALAGIFISFAAIFEFILLCDRIQLCFERVHFEIKMLMRTGSYDAADERIEEIRAWHNHVTQILGHLNKFWKNFLFAFYTLVVPSAIALFYGGIYIDIEKGPRVALIICAICHVLIIATVSTKAAVVHTWAHKPYTLLYSLTVKKRSSIFGNEMLLFLQRLQSGNIGFTCSNMFTITPNILLTITTALATYILALKSGIQCGGQ